MTASIMVPKMRWEKRCIVPRTRFISNETISASMHWAAIANSCTLVKAQARVCDRGHGLQKRLGSNCLKRHPDPYRAPHLRENYDLSAHHAIDAGVALDAPQRRIEGNDLVAGEKATYPGRRIECFRDADFAGVGQ